MCTRCHTTRAGSWAFKISYGVATISRLLKIKVSFAKETYQRDDILQKRPIIFRSLLIVATPYHVHSLSLSLCHVHTLSFSLFVMGREDIMAGAYDMTLTHTHTHSHSLSHTHTHQVHITLHAHTNTHSRSLSHTHTHTHTHVRFSHVYTLPHDMGRLTGRVHITYTYPHSLPFSISLSHTHTHTHTHRCELQPFVYAAARYGQTHGPCAAAPSLQRP